MGGGGGGSSREGWGSAEATEMITNNLFYITVKFGDENPKEVEDLWRAICEGNLCWPRNLKIVIRYTQGLAGKKCVPQTSQCSHDEMLPDQ